MLVAGPTQYLLSPLGEHWQLCLLFEPAHLPHLHLQRDPARRAGLGNWTLLYWAWWISWSPSSVSSSPASPADALLREFILGVLFVPTAFNLLWMTVFGNAAIWASWQEGAQALIDSGPATSTPC